MTDSESGWFGFTPVDPAQKAQKVRAVFDSVAGRYDLMNDVMSMGVHRLWKASLMDQIGPRAGQTLLDVAGGTGDVAMSFLKRARQGVEKTPKPARAIVCDINAAMVAVGRDRALDRGYGGDIEWVVGDAMALPVPDASVDVYTIAFGLRNVTHIDKALAEARRVLKPQGRFFCLEFSHVVMPLLDKVYDRYSFDVLPRMGQWIAGDRAAYQYLVESIRKFPDQQNLADRMTAVGFEMVKWRNLSGGIAAIHSGWKV